MAVMISVLLMLFTIVTPAQADLSKSMNRSLEQIARAEYQTARFGKLNDGNLLNLNTALANEIRSASLISSSGESAKNDLNDGKKSGRESKVPDEFKQPLPDHSLNQDPELLDKPPGFNWNEAFRQSMIFLGIQHAFRLATEEGTRADLKGPFIKDYFRALKNLRGWNDADPFIVNYIGHSMMGSVSGFIQIQNDPKGIDEKLSLKKSYWTSRLKALGWSAAYSAQFELGPISEASLGNIGIRPYGKAKNPLAYVDLVVTPVVGTGWLVGEDALDQYFISRIEHRIPRGVVLKLFRSFLNPTRSFANLMRGKWPWYRDNRP